MNFGLAIFALLSAAAPAGLEGELTVVYEFDEGRLTTQENWNFRNSGAPVQEGQLTIELPPNGRNLKLEEKVKGFRANEDRRSFSPSEPLGATGRATGM